jgi:hypothetical protein
MNLTAAVSADVCAFERLLVDEDELADAGSGERMRGGCLTRLEQHPQAPGKRYDARNPCNHTA